MKIKIVIVDFEIPPHLKRWGLRIGIPGLVVGLGAMAYASVPISFTRGSALTATDLNADFNTLDNRVSSLEDGGTPYAAQAGHATTADSATHASDADSATNASHATSADNATTAGSTGILSSYCGPNSILACWNGSTLSFRVDATPMVKTFIVPHPTDSSRYLVHATLEGPENAVFYRGSARLRNALAEVTLPSYFEAATRESDRTVLVTPTFETADEPVSALAASGVRRGSFLVRAIDGNNQRQAFDWEVKAIRADVPALLVEPKRDEITVRGDGPYRYFIPKRN
jgi:hypothetical protein